MKPSRSLVFCRESGRSKTLFKTESKADNFIKFNADEIRESTGFAPVRSYYCISCGGWHVTHMPEFVHSRTASEVLTDKMNEDLKKKKKMDKNISRQRAEIRVRNRQRIDNIRTSLDAVQGQVESGDMYAARETLSGAYRELQSIMGNDCNRRSKITLHRRLDSVALYLGVSPVKV